MRMRKRADRARFGSKPISGASICIQGWKGYDSWNSIRMINLRLRRGNRSRGVEDPGNPRTHPADRKNLVIRMSINTENWLRADGTLLLPRTNGEYRSEIERTYSWKKKGAPRNQRPGF